MSAANPSQNLKQAEALSERSDKLVAELNGKIKLKDIIPEAYNLVADSRKFENQKFGWDTSREVDQLAYSMAEADAKGFMAHDRGNFEAAEAYFFVKEANMFTSKLLEGETSPEEIYRAAKAYANTLRAKDCVEWANLATDTKKKVAERTGLELNNLENSIEDYYAELSSTEVFEKLNDEEKEILGVREVESRDFMIESENGEYATGWESLINDKEGFALVEEFSKIRANALNIEEDYYTEGWFIPHKTVSPFARICKMSRCAEIGAATGVKEFINAARVYSTEDPIEMVTNNPKPSDGLYEASISAQKYVEAVQAHDFKSPFGVIRMTTAAAPYYKVSLMDHFDDSVEQSMQAMEDSIYTYNEDNWIWRNYMSEYGTSPTSGN